MDKRKSLSIVLIFTLFLSFNLISCSGGGGGGDVSGAPPLTVFVTSAGGDGNLNGWTDAGGNTGVAAGDAICQAAADSAGLPGTYKAWLSDGTTDAYCHILGYDGETVGNECGQGTLPIAAGPWVRTDGNPFAPTIDKLINDGQVFTPVIYDENGARITGSVDGYFTGTSADGTRDGLSHCVGWTSNNGADNAALGKTAGTTTWWTEVTGTGCSVAGRLLCFQTGTGGPLPAITAPALSKKVFVTSVKGTGDLTDASSWPAYTGSAIGVEAGDTICKARAAAASLPNASKFKAWLTDDTHLYADARFTSNGPWYRLDGVKVADDMAALKGTASTPLFTAITYTETGIYVKDSIYRVWTGTGDNGAGLTDNCHNWGDGTSGYSGVFGDPHTADSWWTGFSSFTCDYTAALYCFEDE